MSYHRLNEPAWTILDRMIRDVYDEARAAQVDELLDRLPKDVALKLDAAINGFGVKILEAAFLAALQVTQSPLAQTLTSAPDSPDPDVWDLGDILGK